MIQTYIHTAMYTTNCILCMYTCNAHVPYISKCTHDVHIYIRHVKSLKRTYHNFNHLVITDDLSRKVLLNNDDDAADDGDKYANNVYSEAGEDREYHIPTMTY